ncbi:hypothetical protein TeGR_g9236 [Tetraparma gracilis]|uniref:Uncharacterized protein n=1 Tax=Tetraparma gracilis TaxID=2962635 RepID=A0ABQ6MHP9_9STRA|nr:hypothetical protein TeGR_g9236 [Tetraparma gracilis]
MVTACFVCRAGSEVTIGGHMYSRRDSPRYFRRHVLFHWPLEVLLDVFVCYLHDWKPGNHVPWLFTLTYFLANAAAGVFFFERKQGTRRAVVWESFLYAMTTHAVIIIAIYSHVLPIRYLAGSTSDGLGVSIATGVFFPLLTLAIRKFMISMLWSALYKRFLEKTMTRTEIYESYHSWCKTISITLMLTPTCLMFLNTDLRYACLAACSNMAIELLGKCWVLFSTRLRLAEHLGVQIKSQLSKVGQQKSKLKVEMIMESSSSGSGGSSGGNSNDPSPDPSPGPSPLPSPSCSQVDPISAPSAYLESLAMHVSELRSLQTPDGRADEFVELLATSADEIAALRVTVEDLEREEEVRKVGVHDVIVLTCVFYLVEAVTDFAFVLLMEMLWSMPIVTATAEVQNKGRWLWFKSVVGLSFVLNGMTACIGMATSVVV